MNKLPCIVRPDLNQIFFWLSIHIGLYFQASIERGGIVITYEFHQTICLRIPGLLLKMKIQRFCPKPLNLNMLVSGPGIFINILCRWFFAWQLLRNIIPQGYSRKKQLFEINISRLVADIKSLNNWRSETMHTMWYPIVAEPLDI